MQTSIGRTSQQVDEDLRIVRLARGLRAVAATVIVGGIVIAAFDTVPTTERLTSHDAIADPAENAALSVPRSRPALSGPESREVEPAVERIERSMEHPG